jgi:excisionase family DNA binding protein
VVVDGSLLACCKNGGPTLPELRAAGLTEGTDLSLGQAARVLGVSPKTLSRWADEGRISCAVTLGGRRRFRPDLTAGNGSSEAPPG